MKSGSWARFKGTCRNIAISPTTCVSENKCFYYALDVKRSAIYFSDFRQPNREGFYYARTRTLQEYT